MVITSPLPICVVTCFFEFFFAPAAFFSLWFFSMQSLHLPCRLPAHPASFHSFGVKSSSFLNFPQAPRHCLHSVQLLHWRCFVARHALEEKQSSVNHCWQLPKHSLRNPSQDNMFSQCLQNLLPSVRFHWISENAFLNSLLSQPVQTNDGRCFCSTASQSTLSPRRTCNSKHGPSWVSPTHQIFKSSCCLLFVMKKIKDKK